MSQDLLVDLFAPPAGALLFLAIGWVYGHALRGSRPLTPVMKGMMVYGALFLLGMLYVFSAGAAFELSRVWLIVGSASWGALVAYFAWLRHRRHRAGLPTVSNRVPRMVALRQGAAFLGLLVSLIAASIEWDYVAGGHGHWLAATLWSAGVIGSILLAYGNRRTTVIVALRAYLALAVIGAIAERSLPGVILAAGAGVVLFVLHRFANPPSPSVADLESLMNSRSPGSRGK